MKSNEILTPLQQKKIVEAIGDAERNTSGEIRIHLDDICNGDPVKRAEEVFVRLGMEKTAQRNGVLIYIACESKVFAIIGDKGINNIVPEGFWDDISANMSGYFRKGDFAGGLEAAVLEVGKKLKSFFPFSSDDINEQPDDISFADNYRTTNYTEETEGKK